MSLSISIKPGYVASGWAWHSRAVIVRTGKWMVRACRFACPPWRVTFDPSHVLPWAWQEVEGEAVRWTTTVGICWQQGREEGGEDVSGCGCVEDVLPRPYRK